MSISIIELKCSEIRMSNGDTVTITCLKNGTVKICSNIAGLDRIAEILSTISFYLDSNNT